MIEEHVVTNVTILRRQSGKSIETYIKLRKARMQYEPHCIAKQVTFSVYRFGYTNTFAVCSGTLPSDMQDDMKVNPYREDILPDYKRYTMSP